MPALTRGPLPARVYWVRRVLVFGTALLLVFGIARLLGNGSDGSSGDDQAALASETSTSDSPSVDVSSATTESARTKPKKTKEPDPTPTLAAPTGECSGADVAITPLVKNAVAGRDVLMVLQLRTMVAEACTWRVGPDTLAVSLMSGPDDVWSSRDCPKAIPARDVVVRKAVTTNVGVTWNAKRSDDDCSRFSTWAMPGWYHVTAAALGGEPSDLQFELVRPTPATITRTVQPTQQATQQAPQQPTQSATGRPVTKPSTSPSGAVEPD